MKKITIIIMLVLTGVFAQAQTSVWDGSRKMWTRGAGTQEDPILIETASNLAFLSYMVGKGYDTQGMYFKLTTDIDLNGSEDLQWIPIGLQNASFFEDGCDRNAMSYGVDADEVVFKGHFDGDNHSISNLYINKSTGAAGLFGVLMGTEEDPAVVENVYVTSGYVKAVNSGGIVGTCRSRNDSRVIISRCWNGANIEGNYAGGIVGERAEMIHNCYNVGQVDGTTAAGGIVGGMAVEVFECYNNGTVTSQGYGGGVSGGYLRGGSSISNCYNTGDVSSTGESIPSGLSGVPVGGIAGMFLQGVNAISNCYNVGMLSFDNGMPGGVVGVMSSNGTTTNSYYLNTCGGEGEGEPKTAAEMRDLSFVELLNIDHVWCADTLNHNDGYPILGANNLAVDESSVSQLVVYPNPSHGKIMIEGTGELTVFNVLGQTILTQEVKEQTIVELPQGLFIIRLNHDGIFSMQKVIVK